MAQKVVTSAPKAFVGMARGINDLAAKIKPLQAGKAIKITQSEQNTLISVDESQLGAGGSTGANTTCRLSLTLDRPDGYSESTAADKGWVTWGMIGPGNIVPSNVASSFPLEAGRKVWARITTNGAFPLRALSASISYGASVPSDSGGSSTSPDTLVHYLLGEVISGTVTIPYVLSSTGCGNLRLIAEPTGYSCFLATSGDPEADPPIPPSAGGVQTDYQISYRRE